MKHPILYILTGSIVAIAFLAFLQFIIRQPHQPMLWALLITLLAAGIATLSVSMLLYARTLNPKMKLLPPPFRL